MSEKSVIKFPGIPIKFKIVQIFDLIIESKAFWMSIKITKTFGISFLVIHS